MKDEQKAIVEKPSVDDFDEQLQSLPQEAQTMVRAFMTSVQLGNPESNLAKQWRPEHIQSYLDGARESMRNEYKDKKYKRWFTLALVFLFSVVLLAVILILKDQPAIMEKVLFTVGGALVGALGGYGYGKTKQDE